MAHQPHRAQGGPPLGVLGVVTTMLFLMGIVVSTVLADGSTFPSPFGAEAEILRHFTENRDAVKVNGFLHFASAVPLAIYAATASARLHNLGVRAPGATIALAGGLLGAGMLALSGLFSWVLSRPEVLAEPALVRALQDLAFATGGVGNVVFVGLLVAGIAVPGWLAGLLPRALAFTGLAIALLAELSTLALLVSDAAFLLPLARFPALLWLIASGFLLPRTCQKKVTA
ncbi:hypothetical protein [Actinocorallia libanotica]|uniref:DUF4386 domain-containing protein n=1 Tax=Actinocorallia libanotica TaxID=46162 RepID=A0ABN1RQ66_9ACTN